MDNFEFVYDTEHNPDALLKNGYQKIFGIAHEYKREGNIDEKIGTYYRTHRNGGIYEDDNGYPYTWYFDGAICWLKGIRDYKKDYDDERTIAEQEEDIRTSHTFDFNYDQYIKLSTGENREYMDTQTVRLHHRVAELQKQLAEIRRHAPP